MLSKSSPSPSPCKTYIVVLDGEKDEPVRILYQKRFRGEFATLLSQLVLCLVCKTSFKRFRSGWRWSNRVGFRDAGIVIIGRQRDVRVSFLGGRHKGGGGCDLFHDVVVIIGRERTKLLFESGGWDRHG